jgi:transcriptional regulator with XRE-family HTH domain
MDTLGSYLKRQRESLGYSLKEIADQTRIRIHYLEAIEENDLKALPSEPYIKGFVKSYAQFLGLEPEKLWNEYGWGKKKEELEQQTHPPAKELGFDWIFVVFGFLLGIAIVAIFAQYAQQGNIDSGDYTTQAIEKLALVPETTVTESLIESEVILPEQLILEIKAVKRAWIMVIADQDTVLSGEVRPGAKIELEAKERFVVSLGKISAVELSLNGNKLEAFNQPQRRIFRAEINRQNYSQYLQ